MIMVMDEPVDLGFEIAWQIIVFEQDAVLERLMPALYLRSPQKSRGIPWLWRAQFLAETRNKSFTADSARRPGASLRGPLLNLRNFEPRFQRLQYSPLHAQG